MVDVLEAAMQREETGEAASENVSVQTSYININICDTHGKDPLPDGRRPLTGFKSRKRVFPP